jgi:hypothetical protein
MARKAKRAVRMKALPSSALPEVGTKNTSTSRNKSTRAADLIIFLWVIRRYPERTACAGVTVSGKRG